MSLAPGTIIRHPDPAAMVLVNRLTTRGVEGVYGLRGPVIVTAQLAADARRHIDAGDYMVTLEGGLDLYRLAASVAESWEVVPPASEVALRQRVVELEAELRTTGRSRDFYKEQAEEAYRALRSPHAMEFTTQTHRTHGGEIASALRQAERDRAALKQTRAEFEAMRLELETLIRPARAAPTEPPRPYGGRRVGDRCFCSKGASLVLCYFAEGNGTYLQCPTCRAAYREDGAHWCPTCGTFDGQWDPGTDHDPRSTCRKCGNFAPGWGPS